MSNYFLILRFCSDEGTMHIPQEQYNSPSGQYLAQDGHCIFEETSLNSNSSIFPNFWMVVLDSPLNVLNSPVSFKSAMTGSVRDCVLSLFTFSRILVIIP